MTEDGWHAGIKVVLVNLSDSDQNVKLSGKLVCDLLYDENGKRIDNMADGTEAAYNRKTADHDINGLSQNIAMKAGEEKVVETEAVF